MNDYFAGISYGVGKKMFDEAIGMIDAEVGTASTASQITQVKKGKASFVNPISVGKTVEELINVASKTAITKIGVLSASFDAGTKYKCYLDAAKDFREYATKFYNLRKIWYQGWLEANNLADTTENYAVFARNLADAEAKMIATEAEMKAANAAAAAQLQAWRDLAKAYNAQAANSAVALGAVGTFQGTYFGKMCQVGRGTDKFDMIAKGEGESSEVYTPIDLELANCEEGGELAENIGLIGIDLLATWNPGGLLVSFTGSCIEPKLDQAWTHYEMTLAQEQSKRDGSFVCSTLQPPTLPPDASRMDKAMALLDKSFGLEGALFNPQSGGVTVPTNSLNQIDSEAWTQAWRNLNCK